MVEKTYQELEEVAQVFLAEISALETQWEAETDPQKLAKMESKIDRLETRKDKVYERMDKITNAEEKEKIDSGGKEEKEEDVCLDCGGELEEVEGEEGLYQCKKCGELFEEDER